MYTFICVECFWRRSNCQRELLLVLAMEDEKLKGPKKAIVTKCDVLEGSCHFLQFHMLRFISQHCPTCTFRGCEWSVYGMGMVQWALEINRTMLPQPRLHPRWSPCTRPWEVIRVCQIEGFGKGLPITWTNHQLIETMFLGLENNKYFFFFWIKRIY